MMQRMPLDNLDGNKIEAKTKKRKERVRPPPPPEIIHARISDRDERVVSYRLLGLLGIGGFAECYKIQHLDSGKIYAAKVFLKSNLSKSKLKKLKNEIQAHKKLKHPNIVRYEGYFSDQDRYYILMEQCSYSVSYSFPLTPQSMADLLKTRKRLREPEVQYYLIQILDAVEYMHSRLIIHRDLKLGNIFIQDGLTIRIGDFGLAAILSKSDDRRRTFCGTPNYIAPEILENAQGHSFEVDIWSIGVIVYTLLLGYPPFASDSIDGVYSKIKKTQIAFPSTGDRVVSASAKDLILKCLQLIPSNRISVHSIRNHTFLTSTMPPQRLPLSALSMTPQICKTQRFRPIEPTSTQSTPVDSIVPLRISYVIRHHDYSHKYGTFYVLSDGMYGSCYNDGSMMIVHPASHLIEYLGEDGSVLKGSMEHFQAHSRDLEKKIKLFAHFYDRLVGEKGNSDIVSETQGVIYVLAVQKAACGMCFRLSNDTVQVNFNDGTLVVVDKEGRGIFSEEKTGLYFFNTVCVDPSSQHIMKKLIVINQLREYYKIG